LKRNRVSRAIGILGIIFLGKYFFVPVANAQPLPPDSLGAIHSLGAISTFSAHLQKALPGEDFSFFFLAEEHWLAINTDLQWGFLHHLHQHAGVRTLVVESGYSFSFHINQYLETGSEIWLKRALYDLPICPEDMWAFYERLRAFNQELPPSERIKVAGIDLEYSPLLVVHTLHAMLPKKALTAGVREQVIALQVLVESEESDEKVLRRFLRQWDREVRDRKRAYKRYWGEEYWLFENILQNVLQGFDTPWLRDLVYAYGDQRKREARMYQNFVRLHERGLLAEGNYFAQFGAIHTELEPAINWGYPTLAQRLSQQKSSPVQAKVVTISKFFRSAPLLYEKFKEGDVFTSYLRKLDQRELAPIVLIDLQKLSDHFPNISRNYRYLLLLNATLEWEKCR